MSERQRLQQYQQGLIEILLTGIKETHQFFRGKWQYVNEPVTELQSLSILQEIKTVQKHLEKTQDEI